MINIIRDAIRGLMKHVARILNNVTHGRVTPNHVSVLSLIGHVWIAALLIDGHFNWAIPAIIVFGLLDALDGALARLQKVDSAGGMLLDATSDRVKEALIYFGLTEYFLTMQPDKMGARLCLVVLAGSMLVSYVKAKGETALTGATANEKNQALKDGFARYEVRMAILLIGLAAPAAMVSVLGILAVLVWVTAADRFRRIYRRLA